MFFLGATLVAAVSPAVDAAAGLLGDRRPARPRADRRATTLRREQALGAEAPLADPAAAIVAALIAGVIAVNQLTETATVAWATRSRGLARRSAPLYRDGR